MKTINLIFPKKDKEIVNSVLESQNIKNPTIEVAAPFGTYLNYQFEIIKNQLDAFKIQIQNTEIEFKLIES